MNKRQHKKKIKHIIDDIQKINLKEDDLLVFKININKIRPETAHDFAKHIQSQISNKLVLIPVGSDLSKLTGNKCMNEILNLQCPSR